MENRATELAEKIWVTKGARFNAHRRLNGRHYSSLTATALMSVYVVFLQLVPALAPANTLRIDAGALTLLTAFLAMAILVLSIVEQGRSYQLRAERLHQCGMALNELYDEFENRRMQAAQTLPALLDDVSARYHTILRSVPENHDPIDNVLFRAQHRERFNVGMMSALTTHVKHAVITYGLSCALIVGFPIVAVIWFI